MASTWALHRLHENSIQSYEIARFKHQADAEEARRMFHTHDGYTYIQKCSKIYTSFQEYADEINTFRRVKALAKLSAEEKAALNL